MKQEVSSKPRILFGVTVDRSVNLMRGLPELLVEDGWEVHIVASPGPSLTTLSDRPGLKTHSISMERRPSLLGDLRAFWQWVRTLRRVRPDVVSIGTPKASLLGLTAALLARVPNRIYHLRGLRLETTKGLPRLVLSLAERHTMHVASAVLGISPSLRDAAISMGLVRPNKIEVAANGSSNGVDMTRFLLLNDSEHSPASLAKHLGLELGVPVLGFVGRLNRDKGLDLLLEASKSLHADKIIHQLLIIGHAENAPLLNEILDHAETVPVTVVERVEDIAPYYHLMDSLIFPTRREGFGNVSIEAQASGIPVITTNATGAVDTVTENVSGIVIPINDSGALITAIRDVILKRVQFDPAEVRRSIEKFDKRIVQAALVTYYRKFYKRVCLNEQEQ